ncbi:hypothetical protein BKA69DRAFT_1128468 [Paraphysoderma sedebokerense]|nr:hypothetical protein BKA69DRAFT_1128468 [Paraphysoderma sedebokerense]
MSTDNRKHVRDEDDNMEENKRRRELSPALEITAADLAVIKEILKQKKTKAS